MAALPSVSARRLLLRLARQPALAPGTPVRAASIAGRGRHRLATEYAARRQALAASLPPGALAVVVGHPNRFQSQHIPYRFRQQAELLYLTGWEHPNAVLVLDVPKAGGTLTSILIVEQQAPDRELWDGAMPGTREAVQEHGLDHSENTSELELTLQRLANGRAEIFVADEEPANADMHKDIRAILKGSAPAVYLHSCSPHLDKMRVIKSASEIHSLRRACSISGLAYRNDYFWRLILLQEMAAAGIDEYFYPPVVAGGTRGLTLHYVKNSATISPGEMVLIDAGGVYEHYGADISRTYPVNRKFTAAQAELYNAVLAVQTRVIQALTTGKASSLTDLSSISLTFMNEELRQLGFNNTMHEISNILYPHSVGHFLGLNVHDTPSISRSAKLAPGNVITIEPGVYVPFSDKFPKHFHGMAIRIEDDFLIQENNKAENLTVSAPKSVHDITL